DMSGAAVVQVEQSVARTAFHVAGQPRSPTAMVHRPASGLPPAPPVPCSPPVPFPPYPQSGMAPPVPGLVTSSPVDEQPSAPTATPRAMAAAAAVAVGPRAALLPFM